MSKERKQWKKEKALGPILDSSWRPSAQPSAWATSGASPIRWAPTAGPVQEVQVAGLAGRSVGVPDPGLLLRPGRLLPEVCDPERGQPVPCRLRHRHPGRRWRVRRPDGQPGRGRDLRSDLRGPDHDHRYGRRRRRYRKGLLRGYARSVRDAGDLHHPFLHPGGRVRGSEVYVRPRLGSGQRRHQGSA